MKIRRKMEIEIRKEKIWFVKKDERFSRVECAECGGQLVAVNEAVERSGIGSRMIFHLVEAGRLHFLETPKGFLLVCFASLAENKKPNGII